MNDPVTGSVGARALKPLAVKDRVTWIANAGVNGKAHKEIAATPSVRSLEAIFHVPASLTARDWRRLLRRVPAIGGFTRSTEHGSGVWSNAPAISLEFCRPSGARVSSGLAFAKHACESAGVGAGVVRAHRIYRACFKPQSHSTSSPSSCSQSVKYISSSQPEHFIE